MRARSLAITFLLLAACERAPVQPQPQKLSATPAVAAAAMFPLQRTAAHRCLAAQDGNPFLMHGDAAWSLIVQLKREEVIRYMEDRRRRGFNTLLVNVIEHEVARDAPRNAYGDAPFMAAGDFSKPNEKYFAHVDWVLERAAEHGFLVLLTPAYLGYDGGSEGWYKEVRKAGLERMRMYGRYLGARYRNAKNVIWVHGGDFNPPDRAGMLALQEGIHEAAPGSLHSFHGARGTTARPFLDKDGMWLDLDTVYTTEKNVVRSSLAAYRASTLPFIFIEGQYENAGASELIVRTQAFQAMLSGACGQIMGNKPVWAFDPIWEKSLDSHGARSMMRLRAKLEQYRWFDFHPVSNGFLVKGEGANSERAAAALSMDERRVLVYIPTPRTVVIDAKQLKMPIKTQWIDPAGGPPADGTPILSPSGVDFASPGKNSSGYGDWLLVIEGK
ncbi:MAG: DUF4038 domain-containing protein [Betaproteobacteria bacterium]|nr:DUF4038 domain-containing protein [Betaproteobacteria bacterium]